MYLMFAFAMRGAGTKLFFMHDRSPVMNFLFRFNRLLIFIRSVSFSLDDALEPNAARDNETNWNSMLEKLDLHYQNHTLPMNLPSPRIISDIVDSAIVRLFRQLCF